MRYGPFTEGVFFFMLTVLAVFLVFDEEPLFDFTDLNITHVILFTFCLTFIWAEHALRTRFGQYTYKDQVSLYGALGWLNLMNNYFRLLLAVFSLHALVPLEADLIEQSESLFLCINYFAAAMTRPLILVSLVWGLGIYLNLTLTSGRRGLQIICLAGGLVGLTAGAIYLVWDLLLIGHSFFINHSLSHRAVYYLGAKTGWTYDLDERTAADVYDWHRGHNAAFVVYFRDSYMFFLQLYLSYMYFFAIWVWSLVLKDMVRNDSRVLSYTQLSLSLLSVEYVFYGIVFTLFLFSFFSLRLFFRAMWLY